MPEIPEIPKSSVGDGNVLGRPRPKYKPKQIKCKGCGASLTVKDERTELIVCDYCGSQLDVSRAEQKVLGRNPDGKPDFTFEIGESWKSKGTRFECIGRMAYIEDGDLADMTFAYLFYNPRMGSMWIGEYKGTFSMTRPSHVMPVSGGLGMKRGDILKTWDNRKWVCEGSGVYELYYVDGALPWVAVKGDRVEYAEFAEENGSGNIYEVERIQGEIEYGAGKRLDLKAVSSATGRKDLADRFRKPIWKSMGDAEDAALVRKWYFQTMIVAGLLAIINGVLAVWVWNAGNNVLEQFVPAEKLTQGFLSDPFPLSGNGNAVRITFYANIKNAWMSMEAMLVKEEEKDELVVQGMRADVEYYEGSEGGEHWTEGSPSSSIIVRVPDPGTYRVFVQGVSASGNTNDSDRAHHDLLVIVTDHAQPRPWFIAAFGICMVIFVVTLVLYSQWKESGGE